MNKEATIVLKPSIAYWLLKSIGKIVLLLVLILVASYFNHPFVKVAVMAIILIVLGILFYKYIDMLLCTKWVITDEQILIHSGVFVKRVDFIELYRVIDYGTETQLIQGWLGIHTLFIYSGDKSKPILKIFGTRDTKIIGTIRRRVEVQKETKRIYEFTNR